MAHAKLLKALNLAMEETALTTVDTVIDTFKKMLLEEMEIDEDDLNALGTKAADAVKDQLKADYKEAAKSKGKKAAKAEPKEKRAPTEYNLFIKAKIAEIKGDNPGLKGTELMKRATDAWKKRKTSDDSE